VIRYVGNRVLQLIPTVFALTLIVFLAVRAIPGDPAYLLAGDFPTEENLARIRSSLGLDQPLPMQFALYLSNIAHGDLGRSALNGRPVWDEIVSRLPATLTLAVLALGVAIVVGLAAGIVAARRPYSIIDLSSMTLALFGASMPAFWLGILFVLVFAVSLHWLPAGGASGPQAYVLPALTLGLATAGLLARMTRSALLEVIQSDYITTARAKGLAERAILFRHALRNALVPILTTMGLVAGSLLGGSVAVETIFAWPGIGRLLIAAVQSRDYSVVQGVLLVYGVAFAVLNLLVDILYGIIDPRIERTSG
jgi:peptide/nickel transport system permease protein